MYKSIFSVIFKLENNHDFDINSTDSFGNTALHVASNRNLCGMATYLIKNGINTKLKNKIKLCPLDLCKSREMKEILGYMPTSWHTYSDFLYKRSKFFGFKKFYVLLNKGSINFYIKKYDGLYFFNSLGFLISMFKLKG
jgi:ankyrin repeat protein